MLAAMRDVILYFQVLEPIVGPGRIPMVDIVRWRRDLSRIEPPYDTVPERVSGFVGAGEAAFDEYADSAVPLVDRAAGDFDSDGSR